jgi:hypothetical protein
METTKEIVPAENTVATISIGANLVELTRRAEIIDSIFRKIMKKDVHYGIIPGIGSNKPSLYKPGSEKLMVVFNLGAKLEVDKVLLPEGHREYEVKAHVYHYPTGNFIGDGVGMCSTMESKYRYRNVADYTVTGEVIPRDYKEQKAAYRKQGFGAKQVDGEWQWVKYGDKEKQENPDVADVYNTVLKMAKKRALIDAVLSATGASDIFTQDVEDFVDLAEIKGADVRDVTTEKTVTPPPKKMTVTEGIESWKVNITDVQEHKQPNGTLYYILHLSNGKTAGTLDADLARKAAGIIEETTVEVRPGRKPDSWVVQRLIEEEPAEPATEVIA